MKQTKRYYFVRDGHHRISVARALEQKAIEATVEAWLVEGPLLWNEANRGVAHRFTAGS